MLNTVFGFGFCTTRKTWRPCSGIARSGEKEAQGKTFSNLQAPEWRLWRGGDEPFLPGNSDSTRGNGLKLHPGRLMLVMRKKFLL